MLCQTHSEPMLPVLGAEPPHVELCRVPSPGEEGLAITNKNYGHHEKLNNVERLRTRKTHNS